MCVFCRILCNFTSILFFIGVVFSVILNILEVICICCLNPCGLTFPLLFQFGLFRQHTHAHTNSAYYQWHFSYTPWCLLSHIWILACYVKNPASIKGFFFSRSIRWSQSYQTQSPCTHKPYILPMTSYPYPLMFIKSHLIHCLSYCKLLQIATCLFSQCVLLFSQIWSASGVWSWPQCNTSAAENSTT